ncbi:MAG: VOC family protein [Alphaproteobacteria bacterium]|nr:VOC family protein [Alphaproteobacteria bacterium]
MITGLNHITLAVNDLEASFQFYKEVLGFKPLCKWPEGVYFLVGDLWFCLAKDANRSLSPSSCYTHYAFSVDQEAFNDLSNRLKEANVLTWKDNKSEGDSLYFLDPNGHKLEIHLGTWQTRLDDKKRNPWPNTTFYV